MGDLGASVRSPNAVDFKYTRYQPLTKLKAELADQRGLGKAQAFLNPLSGAYIEAVHRGFGSMLDHELDRVGGFGDRVLYDRVHPREHVVCDRHSCGRAPDTDAHPDEVVAQSPYDRTQAVVSASAASDLDAHRPRFQVEVVVDDDEVLGPVIRDGGA